MGEKKIEVTHCTLSELKHLLSYKFCYLNINKYKNNIKWQVELDMVATRCLRSISQPSIMVRNLETVNIWYNNIREVLIRRSNPGKYRICPNFYFSSWLWFVSRESKTQKLVMWLFEANKNWVRDRQRDARLYEGPHSGVRTLKILIVNSNHKLL